MQAEKIQVVFGSAKFVTGPRRGEVIETVEIVQGSEKMTLTKAQAQSFARAIEVKWADQLSGL